MDKFKEQFNEAIKNYSQTNQFEVTPIPAHSHNGSDSLKVDFNNLINASSYVALKTITLSPTQIKALFTTPVTLIPAFGNNSSNIGINYVYIVEGITARLYYGGTAYAGANNLEFKYTDAAGTKVTADMGSAFINSIDNAFDHVAGMVTEFTPVYNAPIIVCVPVANPTLGNSKITFVIKYRVVTI